MNKDTTALLIMDFQNDIVHEKGKCVAFGISKHVQQQHAIENTQKLLEKARSIGIKVIFVGVEFKQGHPELKDTPVPIFQAERDMNMLVKGTWGAEFVEQLKPKDDETVIMKKSISPFTNPQMRKELNGMKTLILTGTATNFVVEATTREATDRNYEVIVVKDCCASMNEQLHDFSINNILPQLAKISTHDKVMERLSF